MENQNYNLKEENQENDFNLAKKKVKQLKGFYSHFLAYIFVNIFIIVLNFKNLEPGESYFQWQNFTTLIFWGIGLTMHALATFVPNFIFGNEWEEKKIQKLMNKDKKSTWE